MTRRFRRFLIPITTKTTFTVDLDAIVAKRDVVCPFEVFAQVTDEENSIHVHQPSARFPSEIVHSGLFMADYNACGNL